MGFLLNNDKRRIRQAQAFMQRGQYERARQLLQGIDSYDAIELAAQLNDQSIRNSRKETPSRSRERSLHYQPVPQTTASRELSDIERIAILIILLCMLFWTIVLLATAYAVGGSGTMLITAGAALAYWLGLWISYYALWRWFWVVTAIGFVISSMYGCGALILIGDLTHLLIRLIPRV